jgi:hypothetical protein
VISIFSWSATEASEPPTTAKCYSEPSFGSAVSQSKYPRCVGSAALWLCV